jgi:tetratricopeptide (TPR) repeat protein
LAAISVLAILLLRSTAGAAFLWLAATIELTALGVTDFSERRAYFGLAGAVLLMPWSFSLLRQQSLRAVAGVVAAALILVAGTATYMRNLVWQDEVSLWSDAAQKAPDSPVAARNLGAALLDVGELMGGNPAAAEAFRNAEEQLRRGLDLEPNNAEAMENLGVAVMRRNRPDEAMEIFRGVLRLEVENQPSTLHIAMLWNDKASAVGDQEALAKAVEYYRRADNLAPLSGEALARYGAAVAALGDLDAAEPILARAVGGDEASPLGAMLKDIRETLKRIRSMEQQSAALLLKDPNDPTGLRMRGQIFVLRGETLQAFYLLGSLLRGDSQDFAVWVLTGYAMAKMNAADQFVKEWPTAPSKPNDVKSTWIEVARTCAGSGLWDAAARYVESPPAVAEHGQAPLLLMADLALQMRQVRRAYDYLRRATEAYPNNAEPWLRLCDLALAGNDTGAAANYLGEAQNRGADPAELVRRRDRLGIGPTNREEALPAIIQ